MQCNICDGHVFTWRRAFQKIYARLWREYPLKRYVCILYIRVFNTKGITNQREQQLFAIPFSSFDHLTNYGIHNSFERITWINDIIFLEIWIAHWQQRWIIKKRNFLFSLHYKIVQLVYNLYNVLFTRIKEIEIGHSTQELIAIVKLQKAQSVVSSR